MDISFTILEQKYSLWGDNLSEKTSTRREVRQKRNQINPRVAKYKSLVIHQTLIQLPEIQAAHTVACYNTYQNEVDLSEFMHFCQSNSKRVALPKICSNEMKFYHVEKRDEHQKPGAYGILEPDDTVCSPISPNEIDLYIIPGVAFDLFGYRVGYGGGYYDRYLQQKRLDAVTIGVGYDQQLVHAIQNELYDIPVDLVVTDAMQDGNIIDPLQSVHQTQSPDETQELAQRFVLNGLTQEPLIALHGNLGAGKTEFVKGLAKACEVEHSVCSPTYVFIHEYHGKQSLRHIDCYRIGDLREQDSEFWDEAITSNKGSVVIEWAERIGPLLRNDTVHLVGTRNGDSVRNWCLYTFFRNQKQLHLKTLC